MSDIVNRLRATADLGVPDYTNSKLLREASDEIVSLRKKIEQLEGKLDPGKASKGCRVCGLQLVDDLGRLMALGYSCRRDDCPSRVIC